DGRIAKYPLAQRDSSKLLIYRDGEIKERVFKNILEELPEKSLLVFNNTKVVKARLVFFKDSGARIEIFCLEPHNPADYERAFATKGDTQWLCLVGNLSKWKDGALTTQFEYEGKKHIITARKIEKVDKCVVVEFSHNDKGLTFGQILELLGKIPIPPYLNREAEDSDNTRYQTVYSRWEGSVAAPTAGLHFTPEIISQIEEKGFSKCNVTLHVGAGTFLPVKSDDATEHTMHIEHFIFDRALVKSLYDKMGSIVAVGTTSVRTIESIAVLGYRAFLGGGLDLQRPIGQWEAYDIPKDFDGKRLMDLLLQYMDQENISQIKASTQIMITPQYKMRVIRALITNFHQPQSTLLLLIASIVGDRWRDIYLWAMSHDFRFLSYGDSSLLFLNDNNGK
ncbi:MAG: S-adenosylmethionine:tRNA ribosyltransferase-isomerase, partial [Rikenellaceae bacterium]